MKKIILFAVAFLVISPIFASAASVADLQAQIASLLAQVQQLQAQLAQQQGGTTAWCHTFNTDLQIGDQSEEVTNLDRALVKEGFLNSNDVFQDGRTSLNFDETTASAVSSFQQKYASDILTPAGLSSPTGYVGARTRTKLNALYGCQPGTTNPNPAVQTAAGAAVATSDNTNNNISCSNLWYYDSTSSTCGQKQFCGTYMYQGLHTFDTQSACQTALTGRATFCTMEAKICPDGKTSVSRQGPNCEFAACPVVGNTITVTSPSGGEQWAIGSVQTIKWSAPSSVASVNIQANAYYACLHGTPACAIAQPAPFIIASNVPNTGSFTWTTNSSVTDSRLGLMVRLISTGQYTITVSDAGSSGSSGESNVFSVTGGIVYDTVRVGKVVQSLVNLGTYLVGPDKLYLFPNWGNFTGWGFTTADVLAANSAELLLPATGIVPDKLSCFITPLEQIQSGLTTCPDPAAASLKTLAAAKGIDIGTTYPWNVHGSSDQAVYENLLLKEFNLVTGESAIYMGANEPQLGTFSGDCSARGTTCVYHGNYINAWGGSAFEAMDGLAAFAAQHNLKLDAGLVSHAYNPSWLTPNVQGGTATTFNSVQLQAIMKDYVQTVVRRYAGKMDYWIVVNEAVAADSDYGGPGSVWENIYPNNKLGYIDLAFRWAHEADPNVKLIYSDYMAEDLGTKSDRVYSLVTGLKQRAVPIDGVGFQTHLSTVTYNPDPAQVKQNMARLKQAGLDVYITEMDVNLPTSDGFTVTPDQLATQAQIYGNIVGACLQSTNCRSINFWGLTDKYSWVPAAAPGYGAALLFDKNFQPKPAYNAVKAVLGGSVALPAARLNAGGPAYTDSQGNTWAASSCPAGSSAFPTTANISGTPSPALYQTLCYSYSPYAYIIPNLTAGHNYAVTLKFAEVSYETTGQRMFNVAINNISVLNNFDIYTAAGGSDVAVDKTFMTTADSNGRISVTFTPIAGKSSATVSGIAVVPQ